jgi:hypothetical protein
MGDNIKVDFEKMVVDWNHWGQARNQWQTFMNMIM